MAKLIVHRKRGTPKGKQHVLDATCWCKPKVSLPRGARPDGAPVHVVPRVTAS